MELAHTKTVSIVYTAGLFAVYLGQRVLGPGAASTAATTLGFVAILAAIIVGLVRGRAAGRTLPTLYLVGLAALGLYFLRSDVPSLLGWRSLEVSMPRLDGALAVLWPAVLLAGTLPVLMVELALAGMARSPRVDLRRVRAALLSGLGITFALVFCFAICYVAAERNVKADLSFFRTARASQATKQLVTALAEPVDVTLFYPQGNEVAEELATYFADLVRASPKLTVVRIDQAVDPAKAKALGASSNGTVVLARGSVHESIAIAPKLESARGRLRSLDQEVYRHLVSVARGKRTVYIVQGHEERSATAPRDGNDSGAGIGLLRDLLVNQNLDVRDLSLAQGLANDVPADANLVLVIGPQHAMLAEETASLARYFQRGGRLLVAVDPEGAAAATPLLAALSLQLSSLPLVNDRIYLSRTHQKEDRLGIVPTSYSSHAALSSQSAFGSQMPVVFLAAGALSKTTPPPTPPNPAPVVDFVIRTEPNTWEDKNGDFEFQQGSEERKSLPVAAAVTLRKSGSAEQEARAFVLGDSDVFGDLLIHNRANAMLAFDSVRWLLGEPESTGPISSEEDVPVRHTRKQDVFWFYSSVFATPSLVLLAGWAATRKRRKNKGTNKVKS
jgi:hypothetical protein